VERHLFQLLDLLVVVEEDLVQLRDLLIQLVVEEMEVELVEMEQLTLVVVEGVHKMEHLQ
jgi:hypothetical protein